MVKKEIIENYKISSEKIIVVYNGVDLDRFSPENRKKFAHFKKEMKLSEDEKILLFLGSGFKRKGLETLIKALSFVNENVKLLVIGKGNPEKYIKIAKKSGIEGRILFLGPRRDIEKFYAISDLFVLPTLYDPFSNATLEAMASGIPVITTKNNGVAELIEEGSERYVLKDLLNAEELADKINIALKRLAIMGFFARKKAEQFPLEEQAKKIIEVIKCLKKSL